MIRWLGVSLQDILLCFNSQINGLCKKLKEQNNPFWIILLFKLFDVILISGIIYLFDLKIDESGVEKRADLSFFILSVFVVPLIETITFQTLCIEVLRRFNVTVRMQIILSAILFSISHNYNIGYMLAMVVPGVILALYYILLRRKHSVYYAVFFVSFIHGLHNLAAFLDYLSRA